MAGKLDLKSRFIYFTKRGKITKKVSVSKSLVTPARFSYVTERSERTPHVRSDGASERN
jgi:hypothetical protein